MKIVQIRQKQHKNIVTQVVREIKTEIQKTEIQKIKPATTSELSYAKIAAKGKWSQTLQTSRRMRY